MGAEQVIEEYLLCPRLKIQLEGAFLTVLDKPVKFFSLFFRQGVSSVTGSITKSSN